MSESNIQLIREMAKFESSHEKEKLFTLYAEDVFFQDIALNFIANGRAEVRRLLESVYAAVDGYSMTLTSAFADEHGGGAEWIMAGTHVADFEGFRATGKPFELRAASIMRFSNGLVTHRNDYWSVDTFKQQVGLK